MTFRYPYSKKMKWYAKVLKKNANLGMLVPLEMLYLKTVGHDVAVVGAAASAFIWVMYAFALIVLINPQAFLD